MDELKALRQQLNARLACRDAARVERHAAQTALQDARDALAAVKGATSVAQHVAQRVQAAAHKRIATVVSRALAAVFDTPYDFRVVFEQRRGRTEASLVFTRDGVDVDPMTAAGGGVVDVAAFALRISAILLSKPRVRRLLVLDEPLKYLSKEYVPRAVMLLRTLATELGFQIILVTHDEILATAGDVQITL